eukprot:PhM_4_TR5741/c0_g1_i1/m.86992/K10798/PARP; poly [ADP-ribose] polymerase
MKPNHSKKPKNRHLDKATNNSSSAKIKKPMSTAATAAAAPIDTTQWLKNLRFVLLLGDDPQLGLGYLPWKQRSAVERRIKSAGGRLGPGGIVPSADSADFLLVSRDLRSEQEILDCPCVADARRFGVPVVRCDEFLDACEQLCQWIAREGGTGIKLSDVATCHRFFKNFLACPLARPDDDVGEADLPEQAVIAQRSSYPIHEQEDGDEPFGADTNYDVVRQRLYRHSPKEHFTQVELHVVYASSPALKPATTSFRVFVYNNIKKTVFNECFGTSEEADRCFVERCEDTTGGAKELVHGFSDSMGSRKARARVTNCANNNNSSSTGSTVDPIVARLVAFLYKEMWHHVSLTTGHAIDTSTASTKVGHLTLPELLKAEGVLMRLGGAIRDSAETSDDTELKGLVASLTSEICAILSLKTSTPIDTWERYDEVEDHIRVLRQIIDCGETCGGNLYNATAEMKISSMQCRLEQVTSQNTFKDLAKQLLTTAPGRTPPPSGTTIGRIYSVTSHREAWKADVFRSNEASGGEVAMLLHASSVGNWASILSRGLEIPKVERVRRDRGMLGRGIYFGDDLSTALKYSTTAADGDCHKAYILVCEVALGYVKHTTTRMIGIDSPPAGCDSVHGVRTVGDRTTEFTDDEYVVYDEARQRMAYLVEILLPEAIKPSANVPLPVMKPFRAVGADLDRCTGISYAPKVKAQPVGLLASGDVPVPLRTSRLRGRVVDMIGEVDLYQEYCNESNTTIEAKYVFALQNGAAVCGFEAFINDRHVVGKVKEKEEARKEYKAAVAAGHGAYLMDESEEKPDVFTVSVGNLPPRTRVVIKITYVIELSMDTATRAIKFILPANVNPSTADKERAVRTQSTTESKVMDGADATPLHLEIGIEMPFDITHISCSHMVRCKRTACRASLSTPPDAPLFGLGTDLEVHVQMTSAGNRVPRIWIEEDTEKRTKAAMITFFPSFNDGKDTVKSLTDVHKEVVFLLDSSASMAEAGALDDARVAMKLSLNAFAQHINPSNPTRFNVVYFGSWWDAYKPSGVPASKIEIDSALRYVTQTYQPTYGGTNLTAVVEDLGRWYTAAGRSADLVVITDGHFHDESRVLKALDAFPCLRLLCIGVGKACYTSLLSAAARRGRGAAEALPSAQSYKWKPIVEQQLNRVSETALTNINVEWSTEENERVRQALNSTVKQSPSTITTIFNGERTIVYGLVRHQARQCELVANETGPGVERITWNGEEGVWPQQRFLVSVHGLSFRTGKLLHRLAARAMIKEWVHDSLDESDSAAHEARKHATKQRVIDAGKEFGLVTPFTSMIAVEERDKATDRSTLQPTPEITALLKHDAAVDLIPEVMWEETLINDHPTRIQQMLAEERQQRARDRESAVSMLAFDDAEEEAKQRETKDRERRTRELNVFLDGLDLETRLYNHTQERKQEERERAQEELRRGIFADEEQEHIKGMADVCLMRQEVAMAHEAETLFDELCAFEPDIAYACAAAAPAPQKELEEVGGSDDEGYGYDFFGGDDDDSEARCEDSVDERSEAESDSDEGLGWFEEDAAPKPLARRSQAIKVAESPHRTCAAPPPPGARQRERDAPQIAMKKSAALSPPPPPRPGAVAPAPAPFGSAPQAQGNSFGTASAG